jgi:threonine/homoserine/homoserine lactone efflux protein
MTIELSALLLYAGAILALFITPGPVWLALSARALTGGFKSAWPLAVGVSIGDLMWPLAAFFGLSWVLSIYGDLLALMRWVAAGMFLVMGALLIRSAGRSLKTDGRLTKPGRWSGFLAGIVVIVGNPKAILFYMGLLPGFFDLGTVTGWDIAAILAVSVSVPLIGNLLLAALLSRAHGLLKSPRALKRTNIFAGTLMICVGLIIPFI